MIQVISFFICADRLFLFQKVTHGKVVFISFEKDKEGNVIRFSLFHSVDRLFRRL